MTGYRWGIGCDGGPRLYSSSGRGSPTHGCACHQHRQHRHSAHTGSNAACAELRLREATLPTSTELLLLAQFEQRSAHALVRMVQALLFDDLDVWAVRFHHNDSLVRLRVAITQHACIHLVVASNGARPQSLGSFHLLAFELPW